MKKFCENSLTLYNQGYANSGLAITVTMFCHELATLHDNPDSGKLLRDFENMKGGAAELRNSADAAALLVLNVDVCGRAMLDEARTGYTFSLTAKVK